MKLTYTVEPSTERPGYLDVRTQLEDEEPLVDVTLTVRPEILTTQFPALAQTLTRWWAKKNGQPMPMDTGFKTLKELGQ